MKHRGNIEAPLVSTILSLSDHSLDRYKVSGITYQILNIFERVRIDDTETNQDNILISIFNGPQPHELLLAGSVLDCKFYGFVVYHTAS